MSQEMAPKNRYLIDGLNLTELAEQDREILEVALDKFHSSSSDTAKINALSSICDQLMHESWIEYQFLVTELIEEYNNDDFQTGSDLANYYAQKRGWAYSNIGIIYDDRGEIQKALEYYYKALKLFESISFEDGEANVYNSIAGLYEMQGEKTKTIHYYKKAMELYEKSEHLFPLVTVYNNLAGTYRDSKLMDSAYKYVRKAIDLNKEVQDESSGAYSYGYLSGIFFEQNQIDSALFYADKALVIRREIGDKRGVTNSLTMLSTIELKRGNYIAAERYAEESLKICQEIEFVYGISNAAEQLSIAYTFLNKNKEALDMYKLHIETRDQLKNEKTQKATIQQQEQYKYEKQKAIDNKEHEKKLAIEREEKEKRTIVIYGAVAMLLLVLLFSIYAFNRLTVTRKQKVVIEGQRDEIVDSINYAKRLQDAILPKEQDLFEAFKSGFLFYKPKDIIAGDFYWTFSSGEFKYLAVADCTGHGVPGAMVSVVCATALDRALKEFKLTNTHEILDKTAALVIETFEKSGNDVKDGMDISLIRYNKSTKEVQYSGAYNPLWVLKNGTQEVIAIRGDRQAIGKSDHLRNFTSQELKLGKGDWVFQFSDGFADQFGGDDNKKYGSKRFKDCLLSIDTRYEAVIKERLMNEFEKWKASSEQIDDVCIIGWEVD